MAEETPNKGTEKGGFSGFKEKVKRFFIYRTLRFFVILNRVKLPGFQGIGLYDVARFFVDALEDRNFTLNAGAMAFRFFFAIFPGMIFIFTLVPYLPLEGVENEINLFFQELIPGQGYFEIKKIVDEVFNQQQFGLLSFNFFLMLFTSLAGIRAMMFAFSKRQEDVFVRRNFFQLNAVAFVIFLVTLFALATAFGVWITADLLVHYLETTRLVEMPLVLVAIKAGFWLAMLIILLLSISFLYFLAPETHERWDFITPGSILAGVLSLAAIFAFRLFITNFANYSKFYGSLSAIMVIMVFFYWMSIVLLIGFELNAAIAIARHETNRVKLNRDSRRRVSRTKWEGSYKGIDRELLKKTIEEPEPEDPRT